MMEEYRGLNDDGKWEYGGITDKHHMIVSGFTFRAVNPDTIGRNTYCRDSNAVPAFEGDIVIPPKFPFDECEIVYVPEIAAFVMRSIQSPNRYLTMEEGRFEIVGNIHQNNKKKHKHKK